MANSILLVFRHLFLCEIKAKGDAHTHTYAHTRTHAPYCLTARLPERPAWQREPCELRPRIWRWPTTPHQLPLPVSKPVRGEAGRPWQAWQPLLCLSQAAWTLTDPASGPTQFDAALLLHPDDLIIISCLRDHIIHASVQAQLTPIGPPNLACNRSHAN